MYFKLRSDSSVPCNASGIKLAQDVLLWVLQQMLVGRAVGQYISSRCGFLISLKHRDSAQGGKKARTCFQSLLFLLSLHTTISLFLLFIFLIISYTQHIIYPYSQF